MLAMRDLTDQFKLSVRSTGEIFEIVGAMVSRLRTTGDIRFRGKNVTREALVNAALLYLDQLPHEQKVAALDAGMKRLEGILWEAGDPPIESVPESPASDFRPIGPTADLTESTLKRLRAKEQAARDAARKKNQDKSRGRKPDEDAGGVIKRR